MGRHTKLTPEKMEEICKYISNGNTIKRSCILSNISETIYYAWKNKGKEEQELRDINDKENRENGEKSIYLIFLESAREAEEKYIAYNLNLVNQAAKVDPSYAKWLLQVKRPEEFGKRERIEITSRLDNLTEAIEKIDEKDE